MKLLRFTGYLPGGIELLFNVKKRHQPFTKKGLTFPGRVGLAAGFDKDANYVSELSRLGFDFIEVGTVTPLSQPGNPKPRLFRLEKDNALINRMGFNNGGIELVQQRLKKLRKKKKKILIGGNIGKNKITPNEHAVDDYLYCFKALFDDVDYFVVNVSSPNTPGLRALQEKEPLTQLLKQLQIENKKKGSKPILLKIAPDLSKEQITEICTIVKETKIDGVIATNTTIDRNHLQEKEALKKIGDGGLSGKPLKFRSNEVLKQIRKQLGEDYLIIGVGGIFSAADALEKIKSGADLIQLYTGFVYEGPGLIREIQQSFEESL